jgi:PKD repeat protein
MQTVNNVLPSVELGNTITINEGGAASLNGTATDPSPTDQAALVYNWNFGNGVLNDAAPVQSRTYAQDGTFTVTLMVMDDTAATTDTVSVVVNNVPPVATAGNNITINEGATATFAGSAVDPGTMDTLTYTWDFGDDSPTTSGVDLIAPTHTYAQQGVYTVTLRVADDDTFDEDTLTVTVNNVAPSVELGGNRTVAEGTPISFNAVTTDPGDDTLTYNWDYGDGQTANNVGATPSHTYTRPGTFRVEVSVSDGTATVSDSLMVTVSNTAPTVAAISAGRPTGNEGDSYTFTTTASEPGQAQGALIFTWDFGDGNSQSGAGLANVTHVYADDDGDDMYTLTLTVDDGEGSGGQTTRTVVTTVRNKNPAGATITSNNSVNEGVPISFVGAATDVPGDPLAYS